MVILDIVIIVFFAWLLATLVTLVVKERQAQGDYSMMHMESQWDIANKGLAKKEQDDADIHHDRG